MARRKRPQESPNHERWLVSYADFITLLFAFFVVMFASSQTDKNKAQQIAESVKKALAGEKMRTIIVTVLGGPAEMKSQGNAMMRGPGGSNEPPQPGKEEKVVELLPSLQVLTAELKAEIEAGRIQVIMEPRGLVVSFQQAALFPSGEDVISPQAYASLGKLAAAMSRVPNPVRLEGHTDSRPINNSRFRSNWELSAARSIALLELLSTRFHVGRERISIAGYAENAPRAPNDTEEGRARNRRVDIVILNEQGVLAEPGQAEPGRVEPGRAGAQSVRSPDTKKLK
jgi:chemotaxis protein MotB